MRKLLSILAGGVAAMTASVQAAPLKADIVFVVDVSGSMTQYLQNFGRSMAAMMDAFETYGVDANYAMVSYGLEGGNTYDFGDLCNTSGTLCFPQKAGLGSLPVVQQNLTDRDTLLNLINTNPTSFFQEQNPQQDFIPPPTYNDREEYRHPESSLTGLAFALNGIASIDNYDGVEMTGEQQVTLNYRPDAVKKIVLVGDEPEQGMNINLKNGDTVGLAHNNFVDIAATTGANTSVNLRFFQSTGLYGLFEQENAILNAIIPVADGTRAELGGCGFDQFTVPEGTDVFGVDLADLEFCNGPGYEYESIVKSLGGSFHELETLGSTEQTVLDEFARSFAQTTAQEVACKVDPSSPACAGDAPPTDDGSTSVSEPHGVILLGLGLLALGVSARRRAI